MGGLIHFDRCQVRNCLAALDLAPHSTERIYCWRCDVSYLLFTANTFGRSISARDMIEPMPTWQEHRWNMVCRIIQTWWGADEPENL